MNVQDIEILLGLTEILESHTVYNSTDWKIYNGLCSIINDKEWKESDHPRDEKGRFARSNGGGGSTSEHQPSPEYTEILNRVIESNNREINQNDVIANAVKAYGINELELRRQIKNVTDYVDNIRNNNLDTKSLNSVNGVYTEERQQKHLDTIAKIFENKENARPKNGEKPTVIFLGGRGGSGKSKFNGLVYDESKYIVLDADKIKDEIEEYKNFNAAEVHEESSDILNAAIGKAIDEGLNVVLDATMKSLKSTEDKIKLFADSDKGYNIEMYYMHLPREKAAERAIGRFAGKDKQFKGRYVPLDIILNDMKHNEENFDILKKYATRWAFYNNDVPSEKDKPILIDKNY